MQLDPLSRLAVRNGTDKFGFHDYTPNYHALFAPYRDRPVKVLEIGVGGYGDEDRGGQSLATWRDYFPQGQITGLDLQKKVLDFGPRVVIYEGSQVDAECLARIVAERGPFDLIIDDGSHRNEHVVESFRLLWPTLAPGGIYVAEDVQTAFMPRFGGSLSLAAPNSVGFFAARFDGTETEPDLAAMARFHNMVACFKTGAPIGRARTRVPAGADWRAAFARLNDGEEVEITAPDAALMEDLRHRFVEVDHVEIAVAYPEHQPDPLAARIIAVTREGTTVRLRKGRNDYPSNFAYRADHEGAASARAAIADVLADPTTPEAGLLTYASMLTTVDGRAAAAAYLDRLDAMGSTARVFYQLAGGLAQGQRDLPRATRLYTAAVERYPDEQGFWIGLSGVLLAQGDLPAARAVIARGTAAQPRRPALHLQEARLAIRAGDIAAATAAGDQALAMTPQARRDHIRLSLAEAWCIGRDMARARALLAATDQALVQRDSRLRSRAERLRAALDGGAPPPIDLAEDAA
jgi:hypothetical protein